MIIGALLPAGGFAAIIAGAAAIGGAIAIPLLIMTGIVAGTVTAGWVIGKIMEKWFPEANIDLPGFDDIPAPFGTVGGINPLAAAVMATPAGGFLVLMEILEWGMEMGRGNRDTGTGAGG